MVGGCLILALAGLLPAGELAFPSPLSEARPMFMHKLDLPEGYLAYDDSGGPGPVVIAIPGMGDLRSEYRRLTPLLTAAGYRVVTMDIRGHGGSSIAWPDYSARAVGRDAVALMDHLGIGRAVLCGTSFAAGSALWASVDAPERVSAAVLFGPVLRDLPAPPGMNVLLRLAFAGPWRVKLWSWYWNSLFPLNPPPDHAAARAALEANLREPGRMEALKAMMLLSKTETEHMLERVTVPALVVMGTADPDFPDAAAEAGWAARRLKAASLLVPGAGHYPQLEATEKVAAEMIRFLKEKE